MAVQSGHADVVGITRTTTTALGKQHQRQLPAVRQLQHAVGLLVVHHALGTGKDRIVIGHHHTPCLLRPHLVAVDGADAGDQAIRGAGRHQLVHRHATPARSQGQRTVFRKAALVHKVQDVFTGGALPRLATLRHGLGPVRVQKLVVACHDRRQVVADVFQVPAFLGDWLTVRIAVCSDMDQWLLLAQGLLRRYQHGLDGPGHRRPHLELHFHRFHDGQDLAGRYRVARFCRQTHQRALHRRAGGDLPDRWRFFITGRWRVSRRVCGIGGVWLKKVAWVGAIRCVGQLG